MSRPKPRKTDWKDGDRFLISARIHREFDEAWNEDGCMDHFDGTIQTIVDVSLDPTDLHVVIEDKSDTYWQFDSTLVIPVEELLQDTKLLSNIATELWKDQPNPKITKPRLRIAKDLLEFYIEHQGKIRLERYLRVRLPQSFDKSKLQPL